MIASNHFPRPKPRCGGRHSDASAFTLVELMVVISVLALLMAIIVPSMSQVYEMGYSTTCKNNLHKLGQAMRGPGMDRALNRTGGALSVPAGGAWVGAAQSYGSEDIMFCKRDDQERLSEVDSLDDFYILQVNSIGSSNEDWRVCSVVAVLGIGEGVIQDPQVFGDDDIPKAPTPCTHRHQCWCYVPIRKENQKLISITDEATVLITFDEGEITMESLIGCGCDHCNSDHWLMKGDCIDGKKCLEQDELIMQLGGRNYRTPHTHTIRTPSSYGINSLVGETQFGSQQLMLMDASQTVVQVGEPDWLETVKDRHMGKANVVTVGGSVRSMSKAQLLDEYLLYEQAGPHSKSLWGHLACPRDKP